MGPVTRWNPATDVFTRVANDASDELRTWMQERHAKLLDALAAFTPGEYLWMEKASETALARLYKARHRSPYTWAQKEAEAARRALGKRGVKVNPLDT